MDRVSEAIDPVTHTLHARGTVANPRHQLKAEMFVSVVVPGAAATGTSVPVRAVVLVGERHFVFVEEAPGAFHRREVRVGAERDTDVLVTAGVRPGERVVTDGSVLLEHLLD
jgi:cobalt-zinc-cadmium efflux system membrane fusion protein